MNPVSQEFLDLTRYAGVLGDPSLYFVDSQGPVPKVVCHTTGQPAWIIDGAGGLRSWDDYKAGKVPLAELPLHTPQPHVYTFGPRPAPAGVVVEAGPGKVAASIVVK